jgi:hypothetical protein
MEARAGGSCTEVPARDSDQLRPLPPWPQAWATAVSLVEVPPRLLEGESIVLGRWTSDDAVSAGAAISIMALGELVIAVSHNDERLTGLSLGGRPSHRGETPWDGFIQEEQGQIRMAGQHLTASIESDPQLWMGQNTSTEDSHL